MSILSGSHTLGPNRAVDNSMRGLLITIPIRIVLSPRTPYRGSETWIHVDQPLCLLGTACAEAAWA